MNCKFLSAWTLPELLVVMILSGLIFLSLFEATELIRRFSMQLTRKWGDTAEMLQAWQQLDGLISQADSVCRYNDGFQLYCHDSRFAEVILSNGLVLCDYRERRDTLFRHVSEIQIVADTISLLVGTGLREIKYSWEVNKIIWP